MSVLTYTYLYSSSVHKTYTIRFHSIRTRFEVVLLGFKVNQVLLELLIVVIVKLPSSSNRVLMCKLSIGIGHNCYGESAWPNDILYVFPIVILGLTGLVAGISIHEPWGLGNEANPFCTPFEILPEWYLFATFNLLRILFDKIIGVSSIVYFISILVLSSLIHNLTIFQNPLRRPCSYFIFVCSIFYSLWISVLL